MSSRENFQLAVNRFKEFETFDPLYRCIKFLRFSVYWQDELGRILSEIDERTVIPEDRTEKGYLKWIMARHDIRLQIMCWLDSAKREGKQSCKDPAKAKQFKDDGNSFFKKQDYRSSVEFYTQSARYATLENNDFSVAIANRSAGFCHLARYEESLQDIKLAIDCGYPAASLWKLHLRAVECHVAMGNNKLAQEALKKLSELFDQNPDAASSMKTTILKRAKDLMARKPKKNGGITTRSNFDATINPETMLPKNEAFPFASSSVLVKTCPKRGRHVIAAKQIKKGELLFVEKPFAWISINDEKLCAHCCGRIDDFKIPCRGCPKALYCGRTCWEDSWPYHQWECPSYQMNLWKHTDNLHLAFKMIIVSTTSSDIRWFNDVHRLMTNCDKTTLANILQCAFMIKIIFTGIDILLMCPSFHSLLEFCMSNVRFQTSLMVTTYLETCTNFFQVVNIKEAFVDKFEDESLSLSDIDLSTIEGKELYIGTIYFRHCLQMMINSCGVKSCDPADPERLSLEVSPVGVRCSVAGAYPSWSMMNHSCDPTVMNTFWKNWVIVKSLKDVAPGQEIFTRYGPHFLFMRRSERLTFLYDHWHFHCECEICADPRFNFYKERFEGLKCTRCSGSAQLLEETDTQRCFDCGATSPVNFRDALKRASSLFEDAGKYFHHDNLKAALASYEKCRAIQEKYLWKYNEDLRRTLISLGDTHVLTGDCSRGLSYYEKGLLFIQEKYGGESFRMAHELILPIEYILIYLERTFNRTTDVYRNTLKKGQEYVNLMRKIISLTGGPWCAMYRDVEKNQERLDQIHQSLRAV